MDIQVISKSPVTGLDRRVRITKVVMTLDMIGMTMVVETLKEDEIVDTRTLSPYTAEVTTIGKFVNAVDGSDAETTQEQRDGIEDLPKGVVPEVEFMKELTTDISPEKRIFWLNWTVAKGKVLQLDGEKYFDE